MAGEGVRATLPPPRPSDAIAARAWRRRGVALLVVTQFVTFYLDTVTQIIFLASTSRNLPSSRVPVGLAHRRLDRHRARHADTNLHASRWVVVPAFAVLVASVCLLRGDFRSRAVGLRPRPDVSPAHALLRVRLPRQFAYAYGGHGMFPESLREMRRPEDWPRVMRWCYGVMVPLYLACGAVGYRAYGGFAKANVNLNFPDNALNAASLVLQLLQTYYLVFYTNVVMTIAVERNVLGIEPGVRDADADADADEAAGRRPRVLRRKVVVVGDQDAFAFRTAWLASQCLLASAFMSSGSGDVIVDAQALTGAVGMALMTFFFPSVLAVALLPEGALSSRERRWRGEFRRRRRRRRRGGGRERGGSAARRRGFRGRVRAREVHVRAARSGGSVFRQRDGEGERTRLARTLKSAARGCGARGFEPDRGCGGRECFMMTYH